MAVALIAALFGLVIGSFLNVVIHRVPLRQSIARPASRCPVCKTPISPQDNIPIFSYLLLGGKCRTCKARIPLRYPAVEALTGVLFGAAVFRFGLSLQLVSALVFISVLVALAGTDLEHRLLPNAIVGPAILIGLLLSVAREPGRWWIYVVSALAVGGGLLILALIYPGGMGMGDVKMAVMLGAFLGLYAALAVFFGALIGAVFSAMLMAAGRVGRRSALPFGSFLALGGFISLFAGEWVWRAYLGLFGGV